MENTGFPTVGCYATNTGERIHGDFNYGCLATTRVLHSNNGIRPNTSQYFVGIKNLI
jgi:hypothetical protein